MLMLTEQEVRLSLVNWRNVHGAAKSVGDRELELLAEGYIGGLAFALGEQPLPASVDLDGWEDDT